MSNFNSGYPPPPNYLTSQPTGWQHPQPTGWQQPQTTAFQQPQPTGYQRPLQTGYQPPLLQPQQTSFLQPQQTSFLQPQATGWQSPQAFSQLNMMTQSLLPNATQFNNNLQQSFQQAPAPPKIPWKLSRDEKRNYDQIFRAWDVHSTGFISGEQAKDVFGQSGLPSDDLMMIWNLADIENRGKLNLAEFHVAMALVYRRLNGNPIPDELPDELVPPSSKDLNMQVDILKDILKNDNHQRITTPQIPSSRSDASIYKHDDDQAASSTYKSSSRHLDRRNVRYSDNSPVSDLEDMKRELANTSAKLDKATTLSGNRTEEDDQLERDLDDLKYSIRRVQDDLDFVSSGRPSREKDQERRQLERELLYLMHDRLPEVEKRMQRAEARKKDTEREALRYRDYRNDRYRRFRDDDDDPYYRRPSPDYPPSRRDRDYDDRSRGGYESPPARGYMRGTYDDRPPPEPIHPRVADKTPPPPPPVAQPKEVDTSAKSPPPAPSHSGSTNLRGMSTEARKNYIQNEAQRRVQERLKALGVSTGDETQGGDETVAERLEREKKEAAERAQKEDEERSRKEQERVKRVEEEKAARNPPPPVQPVQSQVTGKKAPPPPPSRRQAPPTPASRTPSQPPAAPPAPPVQPPAQPQHDPEEEMLEQRRRAKEARIKALEDEERQLAEAERKFKERQARLQAEDEARQAAPVPAVPPVPAPAAQASIPTPASVPRAVPSPRPSIPTPAAAPPAPSPPVPVAPAAPPAPVAPSPPSPQPVSSPAAPPIPTAPAPPPTAAAPAPAPAPQESSQGQANVQEKESTNPFVRMQQQKERGELPPSSTLQAQPEDSRIPSPIAPVPTVPKSSHLTNDSDDDWGEDAQEKSDEEDSSDDEFSSRAKRDNLAKVLFGGMVGGSSGTSTPNGGNETPTTPSSAPQAPPAPAPPAPAVPAAPSAPVPKAPSAPSQPADRGSLLSQIRGGKSLKKSHTNDKSKPASGGGVIGDDAPPAHISDAPREHEITREPEPEPVVEDISKKDNRQSVDWISNLATDGGVAQQTPKLDQVTEEHDDDYVKVPAISVDPTDTLSEEFDLHSVIKCRSLYAYAKQRDEDLGFTENVIIEANPCRDPESPWWYGKMMASGQSGYLPKAYVKELENPVKAKALYEYTANSQDEFSLYEGQIVDVVDKSENDWWKISTDDGLIGNIPAAYVELLNVAPAKQERRRRAAPDIPRPKSTIESPTRSEEKSQNQEIKTGRKRSQSDALERTRARTTSSGKLGEFFGRFRTYSNASSTAGADLTADDNSSGSAVVVTGPISRPVSRPVSQQSSHSANWSSMINQSVLDTFTTDERNRQESIFELIKTESIYVKDLTAIVQVYLADLIKDVDDMTIEMIFSNIEDILLLNATFLSDLELRQNEQRMYISHIGDLLDKHLSNLEIYKQYCGNQHKSIKMLQNLQNNNYIISQRIENMRNNPTCRNLELSTHLLSPMQRITRYPLLLKQILKYTQGDTEEYTLIEKSEERIENLLLEINEDVRFQESHTRLQEIAHSLNVNQKFDLSNTRTKRRLLIKEGDFPKLKSHKIIRVVLCNDILLLINVQENTLYKLPIPLNEVTMTSHPRREDVLQIDFAYPRGGEVLNLKCQDRNSWINIINSTKKNLQ